MRIKTAIISAIILITSGLCGIKAQEAIPASGGNASGSEGTASYSVGQVVNSINTGLNGSVTEGVQQPYEISVVTGLEEAKGINLIITAYPNPTTDFLTLKVEYYNKGDLSYQLSDISGNLLESKKLTSSETNIKVGNFAAAAYFLSVYDNNNKGLKTFKIIRNKLK